MNYSVLWTVVKDEFTFTTKALTVNLDDKVYVEITHHTVSTEVTDSTTDKRTSPTHVVANMPCDFLAEPKET